MNGVCISLVFLPYPGVPSGEGNGTPLQCSCLENPRDRGAWWAAVYGVAQSWTQLKRLSSSSSRGAISLHSQPYLSVGLGGEVLGDESSDSFSEMSMNAM